MPTYAVATEQFTLAPIGQYQAVCCQLLDLGKSSKTYKNKNTGLDEIKEVHQFKYIFQLNKLDEKGKRFEIQSAPMNLSLFETSALRKFLVAARGHDLTAAELKPPGVDIECLVGKNFIISVVHNQSGDKTYANIGSIMPAMEGMPPITPLDFTPKTVKKDVPPKDEELEYTGSPDIPVTNDDDSDLPF